MSGIEYWEAALEHGDASLVYFVFDLLYVDGEDLTLPPVDRKTRLDAFLAGVPDNIRYSDHQLGHGRDFHRIACQHVLEGSSPNGLTLGMNPTADPDSR